MHMLETGKLAGRRYMLKVGFDDERKRMSKELALGMIHAPATECEMWRFFASAFFLPPNSAFYRPGG